MTAFVIPSVLLALAVFLYAGDNCLTVSHVDFYSPRLPAAFDGYRIVHISDLHSKRFGQNQERLISRVRREHPDAIAVTGDLVRREDRDFTAALCCIRRLAEIAPVWFIPGNHEADLEGYFILKKQLKAAGALILEDAYVPLRRGADQILLAGVIDPISRRAAEALPKGRVTSTRADKTARALAGLEVPRCRFMLLLAHRPELFQVYLAAGADLTLSGHAHGGQVRLPFLGGLFSPSQGWLPPYTNGLYLCGSQGMAVSRGLGGKRMIPRVFNRPHIPVVCLHRCENS